MPVYKNKSNNTWYIKYKNKTKRGFKTKKEALQYEAKMKLSMVENLDVQDVYFSDVALDYLDTLKKNTRFSTFQKCNNAIVNIILKNVKNKKIAMVNEIDCRSFYEYVKGLDYSTVYKNYILNKYKVIFKHAQIYFKLHHNPSSVIEQLKPTHEEKIKQRNRESNIWGNDEFEKFISCVRKPMYKELFVLLYMTGMRLGEALALSWKDFDSVNSLIHITKSLTRKTEHGLYEIGEPKNFSSIRDISLGINLTNYLLEYKKREQQTPGFNDEWFIFGKNKPLPQTTIDRVKNRAINESGVPKIKIHDLRHSHASFLIGNGMNIVAVSKRLGHSDINMTLKVYTHLLKKNDKEIIDFLDDSSQNLLKK